MKNLTNFPHQHCGTLEPCLGGTQYCPTHTVGHRPVFSFSDSLCQGIWKDSFHPARNIIRSVPAVSPLGSLMDFPQTLPWLRTSTLKMDIFSGNCPMSHLWWVLQVHILEVSVDVIFGFIKYPHHLPFLLSVFSHFYQLCNRPYLVSPVWSATCDPHFRKCTPKHP